MVLAAPDIAAADFFAARAQMALSLGFHIVFASIGIAMPFLMAVAHFLWLRTGDETCRKLTKIWSKGVAIFFATGAVSGTVLSFELGLLWPRFMEHAGAIIGMPFSWEGTAFFVEAIALGLFLYGWERLSPWVHWASGVLVGLSGVASAVFVIAANGWMNSPAGFDWENGEAKNIRPVEAMFNDALFTQSLHMVIAAFLATGLAVAGLHAFLILRGREPLELHRRAIRIALGFAAAAAVLQPLSGDLSAKRLVTAQPIKFAAMESLFQTEAPAALTLGGIPDVQHRTTRYAIRIPMLLSFLAKNDFHASVSGLEEFPESDWPPVLIVHLAYQVMVGIGTLLAGFAAFTLLAWKLFPAVLETRRYLWALAILTPLGFVAMEAGWTVTEVGRQPWIIYHIMRTKDAVTPMPGLLYSCGAFSFFYLLLTAILVWLMRRQIQALEDAAGRREESRE